MDPNNYKRLSFSVNVTVPTMFCHAITTACLAFAFFITRFRFLVTVSSKGTTNGYTYERQYNYSQHVHELYKQVALSKYTSLCQALR